jgi:hypothetical protein
MKNRPGGLPRFPGKSGFPISRGKFLGGTWKTYYGPGQKPDAGEPMLYSSPTNWPKRGNLLRVPQVVWLDMQIAIPGVISKVTLVGIIPQQQYFNTVFSTPVLYSGQFWTNGTWLLTAVSASPAWNADATSQINSYPTSFGSWAGPITLGDGTLQWSIASGTQVPDVKVTTIVNPLIAEKSRLMSMFNQVKSTVEGYRPGKTFVNVLDPWGNPPPSQSDMYFPNHPGLYWPMMAPSDTSVDSYFGTNYLHLYMGIPCTTERNTLDYTSSTDIATLNASRNATRPLLSTASGNFYGLREIYFGLDKVIPTIPLVLPNSPSDGGAAPGGYLALGLFPESSDPDVHVPGIFVDGWSNLPPPTPADQVASWNAGLTNQVAIDNAWNAGYEPYWLSVLRSDAVILSALDPPVEAIYAGQTTLVDAEYVIKLIASRYGFDPETGKDLG